jgi:hypothetical protein
MTSGVFMTDHREDFNSDISLCRTVSAPHLVFSFKLMYGSAFYLLHAGFLLGLFFEHEDGGDMILRNVG